MWLISEEQQQALFALYTVLVKSKATSDVKISETKSGKGDGIEDLVVEFFYAPDGKDKTIYFARMPAKNNIEVWQDASNSLPEDLRQRITKNLHNFTYSQERNVHKWIL